MLFNKNLTDKKIQNDVSDDHVKCAEINQTGREVATISFPKVRTKCAEGRLNHAIVHNFIPIFTGDDSEQHRNASNWGSEICTSSDLFAMLDRSKKYCAG